jgi:hypothetical protein
MHTSRLFQHILHSRLLLCFPSQWRPLTSDLRSKRAPIGFPRLLNIPCCLQFAFLVKEPVLRALRNAHLAVVGWRLLGRLFIISGILVLFEYHLRFIMKQRLFLFFYHLCQFLIDQHGQRRQSVWVSLLEFWDFQLGEKTWRKCGDLSTDGLCARDKFLFLLLLVVMDRILERQILQLNISVVGTLITLCFRLTCLAARTINLRRKFRRTVLRSKLELRSLLHQSRRC